MQLMPCIVTSLEDPDAEWRVEVRPLQDADGDGDCADDPHSTTPAFWARIASPRAGKFVGVATPPAIGDEVLVARCADGSAYVLGGLWSAANPAPIAFGAGAPAVVIETRHGTRIVVDGASPGVELATASGQRLRIEDDPARVIISDGNGTEVSLSPSGLSLASSRDVEVRASAELSVAASALRIESDSLLRLKAAIVAIDAASVLVNGRPLP